MGIRDKRVDMYIKKSAEFSRPILEHLRDLVHASVPEVEETIKWGFPNFEFRGPLCSMAAFKQHSAFSFWKASLMSDPRKLFTKSDSMGHLGRLLSVRDLPSDKILKAYIAEAAALNRDGIKIKKPKSKPKPPIRVPADVKSALKRNRKALATFTKFSASHKREYLEWITEAKTEETREKRLATAIEWMAEGKSRNWKYKKQ
jgi:uncharacterized protein YdeI (YjbR/CyaY-like superfamily)